jgi:hypothetical protein
MDSKHQFEFIAEIDVSLLPGKREGIIYNHEEYFLVQIIPEKQIFYNDEIIAKII